MKKTLQLLAAASLLLLFILASFPINDGARNVKAQTTPVDEGIIEINVSARSTFLHAEPWKDLDDDDLADPDAGGPVELPAIVDLQASGFVPGDNILISFKGQANWGAEGKGLWDPDEPIVYYDMTKDTEAVLVGVFSTNNVLTGIDQARRVPGAIDAGPDVDTGVTWYDEEPTDIPEDFPISPSTGFWISIPRNAKFLFLGIPDGYLPDNIGFAQVTIEKDTDGDGLVDSWEIKGIDFDKDGEIDLDLPMLGADFEHKDIFVEADYMLNRAPDPDAISDVKNAFAESPVSNPDGVNGINLHVIVDEEVPSKEVLNNFGDLYSIKNTYFGTAEERENVNTIQAKKLMFRYCLFANKIWFDPPNYTCPGVAEGITSDDFILAFGALDFGGSREEQAAVFMHELGHTLGLRHGGNVDVNYKPNYLSIMNYAFQFNSWKPTRPLDYSQGSCIDLNESCLNEPEGIGYLEETVWRDPTGKLYISDGNLDINWDTDKEVDIGTAKVNLNHNPSEDYTSPAGEKLTDYNDWANLVYRFRGTPLSAASATPEDYHMELTADQIKQMREEAKNIVHASSPIQNSPDSGLPSAAVYAAIAAIVIAVSATAIWMFRKRRGKKLSYN